MQSIAVILATRNIPDSNILKINETRKKEKLINQKGFDHQQWWAQRTLMGSPQCILLSIKMVKMGRRVRICICYLYMTTWIFFKKSSIDLEDHFSITTAKLTFLIFWVVFSFSHWKTIQASGHDAWEGLKSSTVAMWNDLLRVIMPVCIKCLIWRKIKRKSILFVGEKNCKHKHISNLLVQLPFSCFAVCSPKLATPWRKHRRTWDSLVFATT